MMESPTGTEALRAAAAEWSLAGDRRLLGLLQDIHQKIMLRCQETNSRLDEMVSALDNESVSLQNVNNSFSALSNKQFIESRVYDDDEMDVHKNDTTHKSPAVPAPLAPLAPLAPGTAAAAAAALDTVERLHVPTQIQNSDDDTEDESEVSQILIPKNLYEDRPLPYIIGSYNWKNKRPDDAITSSGEESDWAESTQYSTGSEEREELDDNKTNTSWNNSEVAPSLSQMTTKMEDEVVPTQSELAADIARRLATKLPQSRAIEEDDQPPSSKIYKPCRQTTGNIFSDEPPPLDEHQSDSDQPLSDDDGDIFDEIDRKQPLSTAIKVKSVAAQHSTLFKYAEDSDLPSEGQGHTDDVTGDDDTGYVRKPLGGVSLFGTNSNAESIGAAILNRNKRSLNTRKIDNNDDNTINDNKSVSHGDVRAQTETIEEKKGAKENKLTDKEPKERDIFDDLFAKSMKPKASKPIITKKQDKKVDNPIITNKQDMEVDNKIDLFNDDIFNDIDIFASNKPDVSDKEVKTKKPSIFDDVDDLFAEITVNNVTTDNNESEEVVHREKRDVSSAKDGTGNKNPSLHDLLNKPKNDYMFANEADSYLPKTTPSNTGDKNSHVFYDHEDDELFANFKLPDINLFKPRSPVEKKKFKDKFHKTLNSDLKYHEKEITEAAKLSDNATSSSSTKDVKRKQRKKVYSKEAPAAKINILHKDVKESLPNEINFDLDLDDEVDNWYKVSLDGVHVKTDNKLESVTAPTVPQNDIIYQVDPAKEIATRKPKYMSYAGDSDMLEALDIKSDDILDADYDESEKLKLKDSRKSTKPVIDTSGFIATNHDAFNAPSKPKTTTPETKISFSDIFLDQPPELTKAKDKKKNQNINALFDDDSDDEALFLRKTENFDDKLDADNFAKEATIYDIFANEPPAINNTTTTKETTTIKVHNTVDSVIATTENLTKPIIENLTTPTIASLTNPDIDNSAKATTEYMTSTETLDATASSTKKLKLVGKLKSVNFNINVNSLLPGASPKKAANIDTQILDVDEPAEPKPKCASFESDPDSNVLDNKMSKERVKIKVKRRPSTRRARIEAVRKSTVAIDSVDNTNYVEDVTYDAANDSSLKTDQAEVPQYENIKDKEVMGDLLHDMISVVEKYDKKIRKNSIEPDAQGVVKKYVLSDIHVSDNSPNTQILNINDDDVYIWNNSKTEHAAIGEGIDAKDSIGEIKTLGKVYESEKDLFLNDENRNLDSPKKIADEVSLRTEIEDNDKKDKTDKSNKHATGVHAVYLDNALDSPGSTNTKHSRDTKGTKPDEFKVADSFTKHVNDKVVPQKTAKVSAHDLFGDQSDNEDLFKRVSTKTKKTSDVFSNDSDDAIFVPIIASKTKHQLLNSQTHSRDATEKRGAKTSLFDDDDSGSDDLFGDKKKSTPIVERKKKEKQFRQPSPKSKSRGQAAKTNCVFSDPLALQGSDRED